MTTWFITGCSTGFGRELAKAALAKGWNTVITARDPATVADIAKGHETIALVLPLDVDQQAADRGCREGAEARFGAIDVLVNNAGYGYRAAVEEGDDAEVRRLFDVNVFGLIDVTKAALPGMRKHRKGTSSMRHRLPAASRCRVSAITPHRNLRSTDCRMALPRKSRRSASR